jgi:Fe2+ or Zn2+ uptake regulation protein
MNWTMHQECEKHYYDVKTKRDRMHLICFWCRRIEEILSSLFESLKTQISPETGFEIGVARLEVGGSCRSCAPNDPGAKDTDRMTRF